MPINEGIVKRVKPRSIAALSEGTEFTSLSKLMTAIGPSNRLKLAHWSHTGRVIPDKSRTLDFW